MADHVTLEQVANLAAQLPEAERVQLAEQILKEPAAPAQRKRFWREIRGIVAYPLCEEDAQEWVSRTRRDGDERREQQWKHLRS